MAFATGRPQHDRYRDDRVNLEDIITDIETALIVSPGSSTDEAVARWNGVSGTSLQNSVVTVSDTGTLSVAGAQTLYNADAVDGFTGSLFVGNGGGSLSHASGSQGYYNISEGLYALYSVTSGSQLTAVGYGSLFSATSATTSTGAGYLALRELTTGVNNTAIGAESGRGITTGSNNTIIGAKVTGLAAGLSGTVIIADGLGNKRIVVDGSGNVGIGVAPSGSYDLEIESLYGYVLTKGTANVTFPRFEVNNDLGRYLYFACAGSAKTGTFFGVATAGSSWMFTTALSLGIGTLGVANLHLGTNDTLALTIDGTTQDVDIASNTLYVDAVNGRVGIGTASPGYDLHAYKSAANVNIVADTDLVTGYAQFGTVVTAGYVANLRTYGASATGTTMGINKAGANHVLMYGTASLVYTLLANDLHLGTNSTLALTIDGTTQNVGIGTASPGYLLSIEAAISPYFYSKATSSYGVAGFYLDNDLGANLRAFAYGSTYVGTEAGVAKASLCLIKGHANFSSFMIRSDGGGPFYLAAGNNVALTIDGTTQEATFAEPFHGTHQLATATKTADYTATEDDCLIDIDHSSNDVTITLPAVSGNTGQEYVIGITVNSSYTATIAANGAELINGTNTKVLSMQWDTLRLICNGTIWRIA